MSKIDIIRDNNAPIDDKMKIWLCAHPDDTRACLDDICRELFDTRDCVVLYEGDPYGEYDREELCRSLSQMNVFVVAVTQKFLDEENRAREVEFKFALENGIRILPILFDADAEGKFNKLCGELHLLKRGAPNYLELLSKSVSIASVSESELEKIRAEFVKRIFFSYRKKDVDSALELIRLIRKNEFCRDVAIWYDDYLVVGENFNDHIKSALLKSDLFVLAITESITEKVQSESGKRVNNYVVEKEFPIARSKGKRILPLRMANVSQKKLAVFGGLPPYVNARNEQALAEALIRELGKDILAPRKNGPQHDYYIGLAYLYGIDVEIDRAVAFSLIKRSAERGYAPAMEKLTEMYRNGDGVGVDYSEALAWQRLLVEKYRTRLKEKGGKFLDYVHYFGVLSTLFDYLFEYGATSEINQVCDDALVFANNLYAKAPGPLSRYYVAMIHFTDRKSVV